jgi:putative FmdB family regulatory protein
VLAAPRRASLHFRLNPVEEYSVPTYEYRCAAGHQYEKREGFDAPAKQKCEKCGKAANRVIFAPPIVFKGSGFYKTDSRGSSSADSDSSSTTSTPTPPADAGHGHSHGPGGHSQGDSGGDSVETAAAS